MSTLTRILKWIHFNSINYSIFIAISSLILISFQWWRDISRESTFQGIHTIKVIKGIKIGITLFITSEVIFFSSFFWALFHSSLSPSIQVGINWPPKIVQTFNPTEIPLLNTIVLISSGARITWAHNRLLNNKLNESVKAIKFTILLGIYFSMLQLLEYKQSQFTITDSVYGRLFFISTGFHGIHVLIGTTIILLTIFFLKKIHFSSKQHLRFETTAWYWHFVDVVWLFLYLSIYWWRK